MTKPIQRPRLKLTAAKLKENKRLGLCLKCDAKWSKTHDCPNKELQVLTVVHGYDLELLDENMMEWEDKETEVI